MRRVKGGRQGTILNRKVKVELTDQRSFQQTLDVSKKTDMQYPKG